MKSRKRKSTSALEGTNEEYLSAKASKLGNDLKPILEIDLKKTPKVRRKIEKF